MSTYRDLLDRLAEHPDARAFLKPRDLPELSMSDLAAVIRHYPDLYLEALAEADPTLTRSCADALETDPLQAYKMIGVFCVGALRDMARRMVLLDLQVTLEAERSATALERQGEQRSLAGVTVRLFAS
jgi:hypothetical protein